MTNDNQHMHINCKHTITPRCTAWCAMCRRDTTWNTVQFSIDVNAYRNAFAEFQCMDCGMKTKHLIQVTDFTLQIVARDHQIEETKS